MEIMKRNKGIVGVMALIYGVYILMAWIMR